MKISPAFLLALFLCAPAIAEESCCQTGRIESAKAIIAQANQYKVRAAQIHRESLVLIAEANKLRGQAAKLGSTPKIHFGPTERKQFEDDLRAFQQHADAYRAHQKQVTETVGHCQSTQADYEAMLKQLTIHTAQFHMPNIPPPRICGEMDQASGDAQHISNQVRIDQERVNLSEAQLRVAEEGLAAAAKINRSADAPLRACSQLLEAERQLTGEFAALKTEYELLNTQHQALTSAGITPPVLTKVSGKIRK